MINTVSKTNNYSFKNKYTNNLKPEDKKNLHKAYTDSFIRNAKETTPMLLGLTSIISVMDYGKKQVEMKTILKKNLLRYFVPVLIASSTICSIIENKKEKKL